MNLDVWIDWDLQQQWLHLDKVGMQMDGKQSHCDEAHAVKEG